MTWATSDSRIAARRPPAVPRISSAGAGTLVALLLALATGCPALAQDRQGPVKIGVLAKRGPERCLEKWGPTAEYLTSQIPGHSFTIVPLAYEEIDAAVERGEVDFVLANSSFYVGLEKLYGANRIATLKNRRLGGVYTGFGGVIFRRADRVDIQDLDDLKGKTFMAVEETSLGGWHAAWRELKERGIDPHSDLADLRFGGTHDAVVYAVRDGEVDAGCVRTDTLVRMAMEGKIRLHGVHALPHDHTGKEPCEFHSLHSTKTYPEWPLAEVRHPPYGLAEKVAATLLTMPADCPAAKAARCAGWTVPLNYQPVHECLKELRVGPYKDYGKVTFGDVLRQYWPWIVSAAILLAGMAVTLAWALRLLRQRKRAEEALAQAHGAAAQEAHKLRSMIEGMDEGIVVADADDIITEVNEWFLDKVGMNRDEIVGKSFWEFHPDTEGTARLRAALGAFRSGESRQTHIVNRELLGMQLSLRVQPIVEGEHYRGVILNVINVTDLVEARRAAEAATRAKSEFLANMSHEIRTPMTAILGFTDVLLEHGDLENAPPDRVEAAQTIKRNGEYLLGIINDILDLSKIEAGKMTVERIACSPCQLVAGVTSLARVRADAKGLPLKFEYAGAIPETIQSDPTRLRQILINLIGNAIKFTEVGEVRLVTRLVNADCGFRTADSSGRPVTNGWQNPQSEIANPQSVGPFLQFDVVDTGPGMSEEQVSRVFRPFTQADNSTTREFGGTGLGLTISKRLAEMLGGDVTVESKPGEGSTFRVRVATGPLEGVKMIEDPLSATVLAPDTTPSADQSALGNCRILLAEDGPDNQRLIAHVLKKAGAEVTVVENGRLAADAALAARDAGQPFDVILMDMQMPVMDGYQATGLLRQKGYTGPIIALTAHAMASDREKCLQTGCDDYASKPINRRKLIETIQEWLRKDTARSARPGERANSPVQNSFSGPVHAA